MAKQKRARVTLTIDEFVVVCLALSKFADREHDAHKRRVAMRLFNRLGKIRFVTVH